MAASQSATPTEAMRVWRTACVKEQQSSKKHESDWGFLHVNDEPKIKACFKTQATKYYSNGATVLMKRIPLLPLDKVSKETTELPDADLLMKTGAFNYPPRPLTAMDSTVYSHAKALDTLQSLKDPNLKTTSSVHGTRYTLEQFGVSHHGYKDSPITRHERRDYDL